ncbi:MAG: hypothetical protein ACXV5L_00545 [Thermoanaerobaculia bacterium]
MKCWPLAGQRAMRSGIYLLPVDLALAVLLVSWIADSWDSGDLLFLVPHTIFVVLLVSSAPFRFLNPRDGRLLAIGAYGAMFAWAAILLAYIELRNPRDGEHLALYAVLLGFVACVFVAINIVVGRRAKIES